MIPEALRLFLCAVGNAEAESIWMYLDGQPDVIHEMIALVVESHPDIPNIETPKDTKIIVRDHEMDRLRNPIQDMLVAELVAPFKQIAEEDRRKQMLDEHNAVLRKLLGGD